MAAAALTPRVRIMAICDDVTASEIEEGVYTLEHVRQRVAAPSLPCNRNLRVYLLVTCPRRGRYEGAIAVATTESARLVRWAPFDVTFHEANDLLPVIVDVFNCSFPQAGAYMFEVWFTTRSGEAAQKGELPFFVVASEE
jgi:hypothetical protein